MKGWRCNLNFWWFPVKSGFKRAVVAILTFCGLGDEVSEQELIATWDTVVAAWTLSPPGTEGETIAMSVLSPFSVRLVKR